MKDQKLFKEYMSMIGEVFDREITASLARVYWKALEPFSDENCKQAFDSAIRTLRFFPKPAELIESMQVATEDASLQAWLDFSRALHEVGTNSSIRFEDRVIHSVVETLGGWNKIGQTLEKDMKWLRKDFLEYYKRFARYGEHPKYLVGSTEIENTGTGHIDFIKEPISFQSDNRLRIEGGSGLITHEDRT